MEDLGPQTHDRSEVVQVDPESGRARIAGTKVYVSAVYYMLARESREWDDVALALGLDRYQVLAAWEYGTLHPDQIELELQEQPGSPGDSLLDLGCHPGNSGLGDLAQGHDRYLAERDW
jgi:uncharacterized protein (DUF433 family)